MTILIIDNYDSFTFNLYQYCGEILNEYDLKNVTDINVKRNDELTINEVKKLDPDKIIISPGPGTPENKKYFGICNNIILELGPYIPILGICLGMQGIVNAYGGKIIHASEPMHGKTSFLLHDESGIHRNIPQNIEIMRYHSLIVDRKTLPDCFIVNGISQDHEVDHKLNNLKKLIQKNDIMAVTHKSYPIYGIQYHPESFGSEGGKEILKNFLL
ncbi:aminodeoxychorismate/anthranilate synthase component II [Alphaproteobacteria bacterium]|nr:aminodeoxychorismate/anthranilate synthase component II [Alphaproteobacteria bacterium]